MATGGLQDTEDSSYLSVRGSTLCAGVNNVSTPNKKGTDLNAIKAMNRGLIENIKGLKHEIEENRTKFIAREKHMVQSQTREIASLKRRQEHKEKKFKENEKRLVEVIKDMNETIENLGDTVKELKHKLANAKEDNQDRNEYAAQIQQTVDSIKEILMLKEQISLLESTVAEKDKEILHEQDKNVELSNELLNIKEGMTSMKNEMLHKLEENGKKYKEEMKRMKDEMLEEMKKSDNSTKDMIRQLIDGQRKQENVETTKLPAKEKLSPIVGCPKSKPDKIQTPLSKSTGHKPNQQPTNKVMMYGFKEKKFNK